MLIFTLPSWYKSKKYPENSIFIFEQMKALKKFNNDVVVLSVQPISIKSQKISDKSIKIVDDNGIITYYTEINTFMPSKFRRIYVFQFKKALAKLLKKAINDFGKPDVLYAHFTYAAGISAVKLKTDIPIVVEEHYSGLMDEIDDTLRYYLRKTIENSEKFICVSNGLKESIEQKVGIYENVDVISNMINPCFRFFPREKKKEFTFFSMGSLIPRKGFLLLIEAFSEEFKNSSNVILKIAGQGDQKEKIIDFINKNNMEERITILGQLSRSQTLNYYINCDCFVLASEAETYGLVYREAMAVGRPIISTKHGGFGKNWNEKIGKLIDVGNKDQLKMAMRYVYENYKEYDLNEISNIALSECSADSVAKNIIQVLKSAKDK